MGRQRPQSGRREWMTLEGSAAHRRARPATSTAGTISFP